MNGIINAISIYLITIFSHSFYIINLIDKLTNLPSCISEQNSFWCGFYILLGSSC